MKLQEALEAINASLQRKCATPTPGTDERGTST